jgi:hypothetical protein
MIFDQETMYSDVQALTNSAGTYDSTNTIDAGADGDTYTNPMFLFVKLGAAAVGSGASMAINLLTDDDVAFGSPKTIPLITATAVASLTKNAVLVKERLPLGIQRYSKLQYIISGAALTAGTVTAAIVPEVPTNF